MAGIEERMENLQNFMSRNPIWCHGCYMYGLEEVFSPEGNGKCKKCVNLLEIELRHQQEQLKFLDIGGTALGKTNSWEYDAKPMFKTERSPEPLIEQTTVKQEPVSYTGVTEQQLETELLSAKAGEKQYYYVGRTQKSGTEFESLCNCARQGTAGNVCIGKSQHKTDKDAEKDGLRLVKVFYLDAFSSLKHAYALQKRLIGDDWQRANTGRPTFSRNKKPGQDLKDKGLVYLRIYEKSA